MTSLTTSERIDAAQARRYSAIAKMEDAHHRMSIADRNGAGADPADLDTFETSRAAVQAVDVELRELTAQARAALGGDSRIGIDTIGASGMSGLPDLPAGAGGYARSAFGQTGRIDTTALYRALQASGNGTVGKMVCKALLQGIAAGTMARTTANGTVVPVGTYGANPLCLSVQMIPTDAGIYAFNRVAAVTPPALGAKQSAEGAAKAADALESTPVTLILETWSAYEKCSLQALQDQAGLAQAVESLLTGAVLRACDAAAWTAFLAGSTAVVPDAVDAVSTIVRTAALIATNGGTGIRALLSPTDYANMMLAKATTSGNWMGLPAGVEMPTIVQSSGVPAGKVLVTSGTDGAFTAARQNIEAMVGLDADDFTKNLRTILCESRMNFAVRNAGFSYAGDLIEP